MRSFFKFHADRSGALGIQRVLTALAVTFPYLAGVKPEELGELAAGAESLPESIRAAMGASDDALTVIRRFDRVFMYDGNDAVDEPIVLFSITHDTIEFRFNVAEFVEIVVDGETDLPAVAQLEAELIDSSRELKRLQRTAQRSRSNADDATYRAARTRMMEREGLIVDLFCR